LKPSPARDPILGKKKKKRASRQAQGVGPEFKPQQHKKKNLEFY
jgi:hypothetical protein